jgi:hypothetical protein
MITSLMLSVSLPTSTTAPNVKFGRTLSVNALIWDNSDEMVHVGYGMYSYDGGTWETDYRHGNKPVIREFAREADCKAAQQELDSYTSIEYRPVYVVTDHSRCLHKTS